MSANLVPLVVGLPLLGAALTLVLGRNTRLQVLVSTVVLTAVAVIAAVLLARVGEEGTAVVRVGGWESPIGIVLVADRLSALMVLVSAVVLLGVLVFAVGQGLADQHRDTPVSIFHPTYMILATGLFNAFVAGDLFNMFVGFEVLLAASYVLLTLGGTGARIRAGVTYIIVSLISSVFFLSAIALIYGATGTVTIANIAQRVAELPDDVQLLLHLMLLIAFGIKAAVFPVSFWLPDSYPTAPAPVTAVFAGLLTKVGVYAIIRTETVMFPGDVLEDFLMVLATLTLLIGIAGAIAQADIKRLLSFTLVSHIGYMIFGIAIGTEQAMTATIYYVVHHITVQTTLFLVVGLIERMGGATSITRLAGLLKAFPVLAVLFFIPALNLGGIPPFSGFLGKVGLFQAGVDLGTPLSYVAIAAGAATSLLTLYALVRVWNLAFWRSREEMESGHQSRLVSSLQEDPDDSGGTSTRTTPRIMIATTAAMVVLSVALTVVAGPLLEISAEAARNVIDPNAYIEAVMGGAR